MKNIKIFKIIPLLIFFLFCIKPSAQFSSTNENEVIVTMLGQSKSGYGIENLIIKLIPATVDMYELFLRDDNGELIELTPEQYRSVSMIKGNGRHFGENKDGASIFLFRIAFMDTDYFLKKITTLWLNQMQNMWTSVQLANSFPISQDYSASSFLNGEEYKVNLRFTRYENSVTHKKYISFSHFSVIPETNNPFAGGIAIPHGMVELYLTFKKLDTEELIKYPSLSFNWNILNKGPMQIHEVRGDIEDLTSSNLEPHITMLIYWVNGWSGRKTFMDRLDFEPGSFTNFPNKPNVFIDVSDDNIKLVWQADQNATSFIVSKSTSPEIDGSSIYQIATVNEPTEYIDEDVLPGIKYYYRVTPVMSDGTIGNISSIVTGIIRTKYVVSIEDSNPINLEAGSFFNVSGEVKTLYSNTPVINPKVFVTLNELDYQFPAVMGDINGNFNYPNLEVPIVDDNYTYKILVEGEGSVFSKEILKRSFNPRTGHDVSIEDLNIGDLLKNPGEIVSAEVGVKNVGDFTEEVVLKLGLFDDANNNISSIQNTIILDPTVQVTHNFNLEIPSNLIEGYYYIKANLELSSESNDYLNNFKRKTIYIDEEISTPAYRLSKGTFENMIGQQINIDGVDIKLVDISSQNVTLKFDDNVQIVMEPSEYRFLINPNLLVYTDNLNFINDTLFSLDLRAGGIHNEIVFSPVHNVSQKETFFSFEIIAPSGSILNDNIEFILENDSPKIENWHEFTYNLSNNKLESTYFVEKNHINSRKHQTYVKIIDNGFDYWWIKKAFFTPLKGHEIKTKGALQIENITAGGNPGNLKGDRFLLSGQFENTGEFNESVPIRLEVLDGENSVWVLNEVININKSNSNSFEFTFPTLGLEGGSYDIQITAGEPEDYDSNDNYYYDQITIEDFLTIDCVLDDFNPFYELGENVSIKLSAKVLGQVLDNANVELMVNTPEGESISKELFFNPNTSKYEGEQKINIGGNYYFNFVVRAKRYETAFIESIAKSKVEIFIKKIGSEALMGTTSEILVECGAVGDIYSFAGDLIADQNTISFKKAYEGTAISNGNQFQTTLNFSNMGKKQIVGITKLDNKLSPSIIHSKASLFGSTFYTNGESNVNISLDNFGILDSKGTEMAVFINSENFATVIDPTIFRFELVGQNFSIGDTIEVLTSALKVKNLNSINCSLSFNPEILKYCSTEFINEIADLNTSNFISLANAQESKLDIAISRKGQDYLGITDDIGIFSNSKFVVKKRGNPNLSVNELHLISNFENTEFPYQLITNSFNTQLSTNSTELSLSPINLNVSAFESFDIYLTIDSVYNLYSANGDVLYDPNLLKLLSINENNFLNSNGSVSTSLQMSVDSINGTITFGITRLGNISGVSTNDPRNLLNIKFQKLTNDTTNIVINNTGLLLPDGVTQIAHNTVDCTIYPPDQSLVAPTLLNPPNNSINQPINLEFVWSISNDGQNNSLADYNRREINEDELQKKFLSSNKTSQNSLYYLMISNDSLFSSTNFIDSTLTDTSHIVGPLEYSTKYYWKVKTSNGVGWSEWSDIWNFTTTHEILCREISLDQGWNLISIPLLLGDMSTNTIFPDALTNAFAFENGYISVAELSNGKGYWLKYPNDTTLTLCGQEIIQSDIPVSAGWNLIGVHHKNIAVNSISSSPQNIILSQFFGYSSGYNIEDTLLIGKGYWIRVSEDGNLVLPNGANNIESNLTLTSDINSSDYGILRISDSEGNKELLYLANEEVNGEFTLPPKPPAGIFDLRFSNDLFLDCISAANLEFEVSSARYPILISLENYKQLKIKDKLTNGELFSEILEEGKSLRIGKNITSFVIEELQIPTKFELSQNYPNPFNPNTTIKYSIPRPTTVSVVIYNAVGQKVKTLYNNFQEPGYYEVIWDGTNNFGAQLSSGIYFYSIVADDFHDVKKMVLLK